MTSCISSPHTWVYDVFPSFSGEDVRVTFLSHFLKELTRKLIIVFKDNEIERSQSLDPELKQAIKTSKIAVVVFSKKYASSSWCLNELLEIVKCQEEFGQMVIPVFYRLDPSHVRKQTGKFGEAFEKTCENKTEDEIKLWRQTLTHVANLLGYHSQNWDNEAKMIEDITNDVLKKLLLTTSTDFKDFVGIENHIVEMSTLLHLESKEVRMVGIWGCSGIGKTTIARALYSQLSRQFQGSIFIDRAFVSKTTKFYNNANPDDYNMKLHLLKSFLSEILDKKDIRIDCLGAMEERLKHQKVLIFIDDLDDQVVLDTLAGEIHWFGTGSRIIVITKDKHFLRAHGIDHIYEVCLPSKEFALEMFCRSAFKQNSPPYGLMEIASEIALRAGNLPLGLKVLGSNIRGREKEDLMDILPSLRNRLNGKIERTLRVSYDGLNNKKDEAIFRHIACLFNGEKVNDIKLLLADSDLDVKSGLTTLVDKSHIHVRSGIVEMHCLLQDLGKEIVRTQSEEPGEREFLMDPKDICDVLENNTGTKKVLGIALDMDEIDELNIHENAFKGMRNLLFLKIYTKKWDPKKEVRWYLPECFDYFPLKLRLLRLDRYQMKYMPSNFRPVNLVKLEMPGSKLEKLWEGVHPLRGLKVINLRRSRSLKEIPDLSMATNLERLCLVDCSCLVELPSSVRYLNTLETLDMSGCKHLETLPTGINLRSLVRLNLNECSKLKSFPDISTNISVLILGKTGIEDFHNLSMLTNLYVLDLKDCLSLVELPSSIQYLNKLERLEMSGCKNLETLPTGINLRSLDWLNLNGCSKLKSFPDISTNISILHLSETAIEEFPSNLRLENLIILVMERMKSENLWERMQLTSLMTALPHTLQRLFLSDIPSLVELPSSIQNFTRLDTLGIKDCINLETLPTGINFPYLHHLNFSGCSRLKTFPDMSKNINQLFLARTGIEEVPWWIEKFSNLVYLGMGNCNNLVRISNIYKLKYLKVEFSGCRALSEANWNDNPSEATIATHEFPSSEFHLDFFNLDPEALLHNRSIIFNTMYMSGEEVPSYFTHHTTETFLTNIPLLETSLSQPFFRFRACAVGNFNATPTDGIYGVYIHVNCRFKNRFGNSFDIEGKPQVFWTDKKVGLLFILDSRITLNKDNAPLAQLNYDHVDMQIRISDLPPSYDDEKYDTFKLKGWGIRLLDECSSAENRLSAKSPLQGLVNETEHSEESGDSKVDTESERSRKRMRIT